MVNCPVVSVCYFQLRKKCLQNFCSKKKMVSGMMVEIVDKNVFKI